MMYRSVIDSTTNLEAFDALCDIADSRARDGEFIGTVYEGIGTVVLLPSGKDDDPARENLLAELTHEPGVWAVATVTYST
jgi:hypothetical protein